MIMEIRMNTSNVREAVLNNTKIIYSIIEILTEKKRENNGRTERQSKLLSKYSVFLKKRYDIVFVS